MSHGQTKWVVVLVLTGAGVSYAGSITDQWLGGVGTWSAPFNWSAGLPNNAGSTTYDVTIGSGGADQVTLDISPTINSLVLGGPAGSATLQSGPGGQTLQVQGALTINATGNLSLSGGDAVTVGGSTSNAGSINLYSGSSLTLASLNTSSGSYTYLQGSGANLTVTGNATSSGTLGINSGTLNVGGTLNVNSPTECCGYNNYFQLSGTANVNTLNDLGVVLINSSGTLNLTGGGAGITDIAAGASYTVSGAFNVINGGVATSALANLATVEGGLYLQNGQTTTLASLNTADGSVISLGGSGTALMITGNVTSSGTLGVSSGTALTVTGTLNVNSPLECCGYNNWLQVTGTANINALNNFGGVVVDTHGTLNITGGGPGVTDIAAGTFYQVAGAFNVINGGVTTSALANLGAVEGALYLQNGQTATVASLGTTSGSLVELDGSGTALTVTGSATSYGTLSVQSGTVLNVNGTLSIHSPPECCGYSNVLVVTGGTANIGTLDNFGEVVVEYGGTLCAGEIEIEKFSTIDVSTGGSINGAGCGSSADTTLSEMISSPSDFGQLDFSGAANIGGMLDVELENGFIPTIGESFDIIEFAPGGLVGSFMGIENDLFNNGTEQWMLTYDNADGEVILTAEAASSAATPEPSTMLLFSSCLIALVYRARTRAARRVN